MIHTDREEISPYNLKGREKKDISLQIVRRKVLKNKVIISFDNTNFLRCLSFGKTDD